MHLRLSPSAHTKFCGLYACLAGQILSELEAVLVEDWPLEKTVVIVSNRRDIGPPALSAMVDKHGGWLVVGGQGHMEPIVAPVSTEIATRIQSPAPSNTFWMVGIIDDSIEVFTCRLDAVAAGELPS